ncbi:response regulator transcription factor [Streptomyces sp. NPDC085466]|uniref:response regulator transcription factor n=1 Tax=Streptomyces sp. NPDC085466 TaxID=3365725 RepID=UPI0037CE5D92
MTRVLVVEDDAQLARALVINLQARKYSVDAAPDGATALRLVASERPDVILLDLGLPDMDGVDVIKALRGWSRAPVLVLSARSGSEDKVRALDSGADDYMTKPFSMDELLARVRAATRRTEEASTRPLTTSLVTAESFTVDLVAKKVRWQDREDTRGRGDGRPPGDRAVRVTAVVAQAVRPAPVGVLVADVVTCLQRQQDGRPAFPSLGEGRPNRVTDGERVLVQRQTVDDELVVAAEDAGCGAGGPAVHGGLTRFRAGEPDR